MARERIAIKHLRHTGRQAVKPEPFSRILYPTEVLVANNVSGAPRNDCIVVDAGLHAVGDTMTFLHGKAGTVPVERAPNGTLFVRVGLNANQFVVLR
jgi:hypothetical protein